MFGSPSYSFFVIKKDAVKEFMIAWKVLWIFLLQEILKHSDAKVLVDECDLYENTPLHVAAKKGYALVAEVGLLQNFLHSCNISEIDLFDTKFKF